MRTQEERSSREKGEYKWKRGTKEKEKKGGRENVLPQGGEDEVHLNEDGAEGENTYQRGKQRATQRKRTRSKE